MNKLEDDHFWFKGKRLFVDSVLKRNIHKKIKILDVGSGTGGMTNHLKKYGDVVGIERNGIAIKLSKKRGLTIIKGSADKLPFKRNSFNLVTFFDVLYHKDVPSEAQALKEAFRVLKRNGLLLITDSAFEFLKGEHDIATHGKKRYTLKEMCNIVENANFKVIKQTYIYSSLLPILITKRLFLNKITKSKESDVFLISNFLNSIAYLVLKFESLLIRYVSFPFGSSVLVLAKKI